MNCNTPVYTITGRILVLCVNRNNPTVKSFQPYKISAFSKLSESKPTAEDDRPENLPKLFTVYKPGRHQINVFKAAGVKVNEEITKKDATNALER